jgi:hypothetical protein
MVEWCIHRQRSLEYRQKKRCKVQAWMWVEWCLNMLYYELINKRLPEISISLTSGIRVDGGVQYGEVVQTQTKVPRVRTKKKKKVQGASMDERPWSEGQRFYGIGLYKDS